MIKNINKEWKERSNLICRILNKKLQLIIKMTNCLKFNNNKIKMN